MSLFYSLNCRGKLLPLETPAVMGIINATPDSFFSDSRAPHIPEAVERAGKMLEDGAAILDIGAQSTRPGSEPVSADKEKDRLLPVLEAIHGHFPEAILSIDTFYASVAREAIKAGAHIINDISGGWLDKQMLETVGQWKNVPYICMHMRGTPQTMNQYTDYEDVSTDIMKYFAERLDACRKAGITDVVLDPGLGFSKTMQQNYHLLKSTKAFEVFEVPLLIGLSRKGMIYRLLGTDATHALNGTSVLNTVALLQGADIIRVHDVKEAVEAVKLVAYLQQS